MITPRLNSRSLEPLLTAILVCGTYELLAHPEIDAPIIISDYLHVTHGFFEGSESKLVNGILDALAKEVRS
jgi:N utilization substance protein B